jgi:hypothetical protein
MWASMVGSWHLTVQESYYILFPTYDGTQNRHTEDPVEHEGLFHYEVTYSRYNNVPANMFKTKYTSREGG